MAETPRTPQVSPIGAAHGLGPHVVGQRVVVRRLLRGQTGPTGGPAMTDTLGDCLSWGPDLVELRTAEGALVTIALADIVSGKPVPPRPSVRLRTTPREVHLHAGGAWPSTERLELGDWLLRAAGPVPDAQHPRGRLVRRANSALALGDPGVPLVDAATRVRDFYATREQPVYAQVVVDDEVDRGLAELGWGLDPVGEVLVQVAPLSRVARSLGAAPHEVTLTQEGTRARAQLGERAVVSAHLDEDWVLLHDLWVAPEHRRAGLGHAVLAEAVDWAASLGARTAHLQVTTDNAAAVQLYATLGFVIHHAYRYRTAPGEAGSDQAGPDQTA